MVAEHVSVIGKEDDERLLGPSAAVKRFEHAPNLLVHKFHRRVIALPRAAHLGGAKIRVPGVALRDAWRELPGPPRAGGSREIGILVTPPETLRRIVGTVRPLEGNLEEEGLGALIVLDPFGRGLPDPRRRMQEIGRAS